MTRYALVKNNVVETIVEQDTMPTVFTDGGGVWYVVTNVGAGYTFDGAQFHPPVIPAEKRHITVGSFFDRFKELKYAILSSQDNLVKALVIDCQIRTYIDLNDTQLPSGLDMLISKGFAIDKDAILNAPIAQDERSPF